MKFTNPGFKELKEKYETVTEALRELRVVSRFKEIEEYQKRNNIIRADIKLSKYAMVRIVTDLRGRIPDYIMVGYMLRGKFNALNHVKFELEGNARKDAQNLEKILYGLYQGYHHRIEDAFVKAGIINV